MKLIDRYVYAVTHYLPEAIREDVGKELRTNIEDMLPEQPTEEEVYQILEEFGSPLKLANEYQPNKRYLIGPGYYDKYKSVLKMVVGICIAVFIGIAVLTWAVDGPVKANWIESFTDLVVNVISGGVQGVFQAIFWVTLVFFLIERSGIEEGGLPFSNRQWKPEDLPELPIGNQSKISRGETIFSMFFTVLFTALLYVQPQLIALYVKDEYGNINSIPLFDVVRLQTYMPIILGLTFLQLGVYVWKYLKANWYLPLAISNAIYNLMYGIVLLVMINDKTLYDARFFLETGKLFHTTNQIVITWFDKSLLICGIVILIICIWESVYGFIKCRRITK